MRTEEEIREELENRKNIVQNSEYLFKLTGNIEFENMNVESNMMVFILEWVLGEREMIEETITLTKKEIEGEK